MTESKSFYELIRELEGKYGVSIKEPEPKPGIREMRKVYRPNPRTKAEKPSLSGG